MTKKALSIILVLVLSVSVFTACSVFTDKGEEATFKSDSDSVNISEDFSLTDEKLSKAKDAVSVATNDAFQKNLLNPEIKIASFYGTADIVIENEAKIEKTVSLRTTGSVSVNSPVESIVLLDTAGGFSANAEIDSVIVEGQSIVCDINSSVGTVSVIGKDCTVNINKGTISKIIVRNSTAVINNFTNDTVEVTLTNGTKVSVEKNKSYIVKDNLIKEAD